MGMILNDIGVTPRTVWGKDVREGDGCAFLASLNVGCMELLGDLGRGSKDGMKGIDSGRLPVSGGSAEERESGVFVDAKLNALEIRTANMELGEFSHPNGLPKLVVPPTSGSTGKWEGREAMGASEAPRSGPGPAKTLDFLPREADDAAWARKGIDKGPIKDHDLLPDSGEGRSKSGVSCEQTTETVDTKIRNSSFGIDPMLFREEDPHKFLGTTTPTVAPEGSKGRVPERPNFGSR
jgi:hypothetical protein